TRRTHSSKSMMAASDVRSYATVIREITVPFDQHEASAGLWPHEAASIHGCAEFNQAHLKRIVLRGNQHPNKNDQDERRHHPQHFCLLAFPNARHVALEVLGSFNKSPFATLDLADVSSGPLGHQRGESIIRVP